MTASRPQQRARSRSPLPPPKSGTSAPRARSWARTQGEGTQRTSSTNRGDKWYEVFIPEFDIANPDPLEDFRKRFHVGIFVEKDPATGKGYFFHVTGDLMMRNGMVYETKTNWDAKNSRNFRKITHIGWIHEDNSDFSKIDGILKAVERPARQQGINFEVKDEMWNKVVWIEADGEPSPNNKPTRRIRKCNEWTEDAQEALENAGILKSSKG